jgi:tRNA-splicing ligase RtcB
MSMEGINYHYDDRVRDEAPSAYKDIRQVMRAQKDLVKILHQLRPIMSIKGI